MSDDNDDQVDSDVNLYDGSFDGPDSMGFGPLIPTETERSLMERVRQELKQELKQVLKKKFELDHVSGHIKDATDNFCFSGLQGEDCGH